MRTTNPGGHPAAGGGVDTLNVPLVEVVRAVWFEFGSMRQAIHRLRGVRAWALTLVVAETRFGDGSPGFAVFAIGPVDPGDSWSRQLIVESVI